MSKQQAKVEGFRLTKEQQAFQKEYKKLHKVGRMLQGEMLKNQIQGASLAQMFKRLTGQMQMLQQQAPEDPVKELLRMDQPEAKPEAQSGQGETAVY